MRESLASHENDFAELHLLGWVVRLKQPKCRRILAAAGSAAACQHAQCCPVDCIAYCRSKADGSFLWIQKHLRGYLSTSHVLTARSGFDGQVPAAQPSLDYGEAPHQQCLAIVFPEPHHPRLCLSKFLLKREFTWMLSLASISS